MVLATGCRGHRDKFAHGREDAEVGEPNDEETVNDTRRAAVVETLSEENGDGLPGN